VDAGTLALMLRRDVEFRRSVLNDANVIIAAHALDMPVLIEAGRLMALSPWYASPAGRQGHAALFALVAAAHSRPG